MSRANGTGTTESKLNEMSLNLVNARALLRRRFSAVVIASVFVSFAQAQEPSSSSAPSSASTPSAAAASSTRTNPQAVLRAETRLVQLNVIAQDKKGQPIEGLKREDFTLLDNGKPQNITLFASEPEALSAKSSTGGSETPDAKGDLPPNVFGNRVRHAGEKPGSVAVILLDALNTSFSDQVYARKQVLAFLRQLQPQDHVAIYLLTTQLIVINEFTQDSSRSCKRSSAFNRRRPSESQLHAHDIFRIRHGSRKFQRRIAPGEHDERHDFKKCRHRGCESRSDHGAGHRSHRKSRGRHSRPQSLIWVSGAFPSSILLDSNDTSPVESKAQNFTPQLNRVTRA